MQSNFKHGFSVRQPSTTPVLTTGIVKLHNESGQTINARVLFDTGSEVNLITEKIVNRAKLIRQKSSIQIEGVTGTYSANHSTLIKISPWFETSEEYSVFKLCIVLKQIPLAQRTDCANDIPEFRNIVKADPQFHKAGRADILLGIDTWSEIIMQKIIWSETGLCAQLTKFGHAIFGAIKTNANTTNSPLQIGRMWTNSEPTERLDELLEKFWAEEELTSTPMYSELEKRAIDYYEKTTTRAADGRFIVRIPFIEDNKLGDSREIARQRFLQLERSLDRKPDVRDKYHQAMRESIETNRMRLATAKERSATGYYIPHHPITKRFRVVMDGSCPTRNGKSVNDNQLSGPNLQERLPDIIMRFRLHKFVISADIKKMFLQILMSEKDVEYQKIFWRFNRQTEPQEYVLTTVIFGMKSSPFLALKTMLKLAELYENEFPMAARATKEERYMDDYMSGADTLQQANKLYTQLKAMLSKAKFELGKWKTNCSEVLERFNQDSSSDEQPLELSDELTSILGLKWQPSSDCFTFQFDFQVCEKIPTKRSITSAIAKIYDPSGYLAPTIITAKSFLQQLWKMKVQWDEPLQGDIVNKWSEFYRDLTAVNHLRIPRWIQTSRARSIELHGFADASELGYGAVIYVRCATTSEVWCNLLTSRTKVAPVKTVTIPRLELCAAELLARLIHNVQTVCHLEYAPFYCYSDSTITLKWISHCPSELKMYVATRVKSIQTHVKSEKWSYVQSKLNPADIASRGANPRELSENNLWWHGPQFLSNITERKDKIPPELNEEETQILKSEYRPSVVAKTSVKEECIAINKIPLMEKISSLNKIVRITGYVFRAIELFKQKSKREKTTLGLLSQEELIKANTYWVKYTQAKTYADEIEHLKTNNRVEKTSELVRLSPLLDSNSVLRARGRLANTSLAYDEKHPIIIPARSTMAKLLLQEAHQETLHGGIQLILHYVRTRYWIIGARRAATSLVKSCIRCIRYAQSDQKQLMGDLPKERVTASRPFAHCGVDYFGPIKVKRFDGRCRSIDTGYAAVFICLTTKMVHIECVSDLTTERFLWALARLASFYQMPKVMFSDNAKTFIGAKNELCDISKSWKSSEMECFLTSKGIQWKFITPRAPNQGGIWEAAVKSAKHHMKRMLLNHSLTFERYQTLFAKISAVLNSRPLVPLTDNPNELNYLTPSHAVIGERVIQPLSSDLSEIPSNRVKQQKILDKIHQDFWKVWRKEYLSTLQHRYKWNQPERNLQTGDFVLLKEDNVSPGVWPIARIIEVYPGADNLVRSVKIRTPRTDLVRPINKLIWLPMKDD